MHVRSGLRRTALFLAFLLVGGASAVAANRAAGQDAGPLADDLVKSAGVERGICVLLGCGDGSCPVALARRSRLLVHVIDPDAGAVAATRRLDAIAHEHLSQEDEILFPIALGVVGDPRVWQRMKALSDEFGYCAIHL